MHARMRQLQIVISCLAAEIDNINIKHPGLITDRPNAAKPAFAVMQHRDQCLRIKLGMDTVDSVLEPLLIGNLHFLCFILFFYLLELFY